MSHVLRHFKKEEHSNERKTEKVSLGCCPNHPRHMYLCMTALAPAHAPETVEKNSNLL